MAAEVACPDRLGCSILGSGHLRTHAAQATEKVKLLDISVRSGVISWCPFGRRLQAREELLTSNGREGECEIRNGSRYVYW